MIQRSKGFVTGLSQGQAALVLLVAVALSLVGCSQAPDLTPVEGKVTYNGQPLKFGTVLFQNTNGGQPASGLIQPDGSFKMSTPKAGEGVKPGQYNISVYCYESQDPARQTAFAGGDQSMGKLLVPKKYIMANTSGLTAEVKLDGNAPVVIDLNDN